MKIATVLFFLVFGIHSSEARSSNSRIIRTYPVNGSEYVHPLTNIGLTFSEAMQNSEAEGKISVTGNTGKRYTGNIELSDDKRTIIFIPDHQFALGEKISVHIGSLHTLAGNLTLPDSLDFTVRPSLVQNTELQEESSLQKPEAEIPPYLPLAPPTLNILINKNPSDGYLYFAGHILMPYAIIMDRTGGTVKLIQNTAPVYDDFKPHPGGFYSYFAGYIRLLDVNFASIDSIAFPPPYSPDAHEFRISPEGNYFFIGNDHVKVDMRPIVPGGDSMAIVMDPVILEMDKNHHLISEWKALDHFRITDATYEDLTVHSIDFCHMNSIEFDADSDLVISSRHMDEVTKIDRKTGDIIWRWGGKNNQFTTIGDSIPFSHQHSVNRTESGTFIMMDNGNFRPNNELPYSRAIEYLLDQKNKTATKVWAYRHTPDIFGQAMGSAQRLTNKGTLITWGATSDAEITEVDSTDETQFEMSMTSHDFSYRSYKYDTNYVHQGTESVKRAQPENTSLSILCIPNPVLSNAEIECRTPENENLEILLYDALGRKVLNIYSGNLPPGSSQIAFSAGNLAGGVYTIHAIDRQGNTANQQIVILK